MAKRPTKTDPDLELMRRVARGDVAAMGQLYEKYYQTVVNFLVSRNGHISSVEDLAQEVFLRLWKSRDRFRAASSFKTYLFGIAINVLREAVVAHIRERRLTISTSANHHKKDPSETKDALEDRQLLVLKRVASLSAKARQAIELAVLQGFSIREAANRAGCSEYAFRKRLARALTRINPIFLSH